MSDSSSNQFLSLLEGRQVKLTSMWNLATVFSKPPVELSSLPATAQLPEDSTCLPTSPNATAGTDETDSVRGSKSPVDDNTPISIVSVSVEQLQRENEQLRRDRADLQRILAHCISRKSRTSTHPCENTEKRPVSENKSKKESSAAPVSARSPGRLDTAESSYTDLDGRVVGDEKRRVSSKEVFLVLRGEIKRAQEVSADLDARLKSALLKLQESRVESLQVLPLRLKLREMERSHTQALDKLKADFDAKEQLCVQLMESNVRLEGSEAALARDLAHEKSQLTLALNRVEFLDFRVEELCSKLAVVEQELTALQHNHAEVIQKLRQSEEALSLCTLEKGRLERRASSLSKEVVRMQDLCTELKVSEPEDVVRYVRTLEARSACTAVTSGSETMSTVDDLLAPVNNAIASCPSILGPQPRAQTSARLNSADKPFRVADRAIAYGDDPEFSGGCFPSVIFCGWGGGGSVKPKSKRRSNISKSK